MKSYLRICMFSKKRSHKFLFRLTASGRHSPMSKLPRKVEAKLEDLYRQQTAAKEELGKPFPQEEELRTKSSLGNPAGRDKSL